MGIGQGFDQVPYRTREAFLGQVTEDSQLRRYASGINKAPQRVEIWTLTIDSDPGAIADDSISFDFGGNRVVTVKFSADAGDDTSDIAAKVKLAIEAEPLAYGRVETSIAANVVTITGRTAGQTFTVTEALAYASVSNTQDAAEADDIPIGRAIIHTGFNNTNPRRGEADKLVALAAETLFTAQVQTLTVDAGATGDRAVKVFEIRAGQRILRHQAAYTGSATAATEATALAAAIELGPSDFVSAVAASADVTVTAEVAGLEFDVEVEAVGTSKVNTTGPSPKTSLKQALAGISMLTRSEEASTIGATEGRYLANRGVDWLETGTIMVECDEALNGGEAVYVELGTTDTGKLFASAGANRVAIGTAHAVWQRRSFDGLDHGVINLNYQNRA